MRVICNLAFCSGITVCALLPGCSSSGSVPAQSASPGLVRGKSTLVIGQPILSGQEVSPYFALEVPVTNTGPYKLKAAIEIKGAPSEVLDSRRLSGLGAGKGTTVFTICEVTRKRSKPIFINIKWQRGLESGVSSFKVPPEQSNITRK